MLDIGHLVFEISNDGIKMISANTVCNECRTLGLIKILNGAFPYVKEKYGDIKTPIKIVIQTDDRPKNVELYDNKTIVFQTVSDKFKDDLFPDYVFGNWWHIGLTDFDEFTNDVAANSIANPPIYNKVFWAGAIQKIPQRRFYKHISNKYPNIFETMTIKWGNHSNPSRFVKMRDQSKWAILIDLTGDGWSGRLKILPFCKRPLIIANRTFWGWSDFMILKTKNFYMTNKDLSNLLPIINYINDNKEKAQIKADNLFKYVSETFRFDNICKYASDIIVKKMIALDKK